MFKIYRTLRSYIGSFNKIIKHVPENGRILEIGSGYGVFSLMLAKSKERKITGIELDCKKVEIANKMAENIENLKFICMDARNLSLKEKFDAVICIDLLHHLPKKENHEMIFKKVKDIIDKNGIFVLKDVDKKPLYKYYWNLLHDIIMTKNLNFSFSSGEEIRYALEKTDFRIRHYENVSNFLYPYYLFVCENVGT